METENEIHSLALFMWPISFSSLMARVMSPLMRSFPDMNAIVGLIFPKIRSTWLLIQRPGWCCVRLSTSELTDKHFAEVVGVHLHDYVSFDRRLAWPRAASAGFQVKKPDSCMFTLWTQRQSQDQHTHRSWNKDLHRSTNSRRSHKINHGSQWVSEILDGFIKNITSTLDSKFWSHDLCCTPRSHMSSRTEPKRVPVKISNLDTITLWWYLKGQIDKCPALTSQHPH